LTSEQGNRPFKPFFEKFTKFAELVGYAANVFYDTLAFAGNDRLQLAISQRYLLIALHSVLVGYCSRLDHVSCSVSVSTSESFVRRVVPGMLAPISYVSAIKPSSFSSSSSNASKVGVQPPSGLPRKYPGLLSDAKHNSRYQNGHCIVCGKSGHFRLNCPFNCYKAVKQD
jgi:hypothetical protein